MAGNYLSNPSPQWLDDSGDPLSGGSLNFFEAGGTSTPLAVFTDTALSAGSATVITLDSDGRSPTNIFLQQQEYNLVVKNSAGSTQTNATRDNVSNILQVLVTGLATVLTIAALTALVKATLTDLEIEYVFGRVNKNDGAGGYFQWNASSSATVNLGTVFASDEGSTGRWIRVPDRPLTLPMFGALGTGPGADDSDALESAIITASTEGLDLIIPTPATSYDLSTQKTISSLSGPLTIKGENLAAFTWGAARAAGRALRISDTNGHDVFISGIQFDGLTNIEEFLRVDNPSANMNDSSIGIFEIKDCLLENFFMPVGGTVGSTGLLVIGGFSEARAIRTTIRNCDRANGAGTPGVVGSHGLTFIDNGVNQYIKKMIATDCTFDTITNTETSDPDNADCDGIRMFGPDASTNGNIPLGHIAIITRCSFLNCKGRGIKTQCTHTIVRDCDHLRDAELGFTASIEVDAQQGSLTVDGGTVTLGEIPGGGTPLGSSYTCFLGQAAQLASADDNEEGVLHVKDVTVINTIPISVDTVPFFARAINNDDAEVWRSIKFIDNTLLGGRFARFCKVDLGTDESNLEIRGNTGQLTVSLVQLDVMGSFSETNIVISGNVQTGSVLRALVEDTSAFGPYISSHDNRGFIENLGDEITSDNWSEVFRPLQIGMRDRTSAGVSLQLSQSLNDDASYEFPTTGTTYGVVTIVSTFSLESMGIFAFDVGGLADLLGGASTDIAYGATANPDTDSKLNVWFNTTNDTVNIKNRLGSTRQFSLYYRTGG